MKQHKNLIIGVAILTIAAILLFIFRKKIFDKKEVATAGTDNINLDAPTQPVATVSATLKVGDPAYSTATQTIERVEVENGKFVNKGSGTIGNGSLIGTVVQLTPNGYYIKAKEGLKAPYYYVGKSQVR